MMENKKYVMTNDKIEIQRCGYKGYGNKRRAGKKKEY